MTALNPTIDFMARLKKVDNADLKCRDILVLWAIAREPGMMGRELAMKLGYKSRSNVQICVDRLKRTGLVEDRRPVEDNRTPNDLYVTPAGEIFLGEIVPT